MNLFLKLFNKLFFVSSRTMDIVYEFKLNKSNKYVWGMKSSGNRLRNEKRKLKTSKLFFLEDGFIHSFCIRKKRIPLSICIDKSGIYYNSKSQSQLFRFIEEKLSQKENLRSKQIIKLWKEYGISKYNYPKFVSPPENPFILLIDQTDGDLSIKYGDANKKTFQEMFMFALKKWPNHKIIIKIHPDVLTSQKRGCLDIDFCRKKNAIIIFDYGQVNKLIEKSSAICVVTSQVGFEALIYGKEVHVFGNPFYSGFGLTIDHNISRIKKRKSNISLEQLVYGSLIKYQIYLDPRNKKICEIEEIMEFVYKQRKIYNFFPKNLQCLYLTPWKSRQISRFIPNSTDRSFSFFKESKSKIKNFLVWGKFNKLEKYKIKSDTFISAEDGFIRSVGLGGELIPPMSLLFDKSGIHYDFNQPSDLEDLLQKKSVSAKELKRAKELINLIKQNNISKYNLSSHKRFYNENDSNNKQTILVLGQVETDNAMIYGVPDNILKKTNYDLVFQVKKDYPNYNVIYKPHPDIERGLRCKGRNENLINNIADKVAYGMAIQKLFEISDRVAVFTSLGGFEALIRGIPVTTYGIPFYSGWGLTEEKLFNYKWKSRRTRKLSLEEMVYIAIIEYPFYYSLKYNCHTEVENIISELDFYRKRKKTLEQVIFRYWGPLKEFFKNYVIFR